MAYRIAVGEVAHETNTFVAPAVEPFTRCIMPPTRGGVTRYASLYGMTSR